ITLCVILAVHYASHSAGWVRALIWVWFGLIGVSTVLTYQHHLVDIAGGLALAGLCCRLFRSSPECKARIINLRIAACYGMGTLAMLLLAGAVQPWGWILIWPAAALALVASAYCGVGPAI